MGSRTAGDRYLATTGLASLAAARHRFGEAGRLANRARELRPRTAAAYGVLADSLLERGRYAAGVQGSGPNGEAPTEPFVLYARLVRARAPGPAGGGAPGNEVCGRRGLRRRRERVAGRSCSSATSRSARATCAAPKLAYRSALAILPGYVHARAGIARVDGRARTVRARGRDLSRRRRQPRRSPSTSSRYGETLEAAGLEAEAAAPTTSSARSSGCFAANGVRTELETALFDLDRGRDVRGALARAREALRGSAQHRRRGRARVGALPQRPLRRGARSLACALSGSARATRSSSSTAG